MIVFSLGLLFLVSVTAAWDGHVCTRQVLRYRVQYYCNCKRLWWCCGNGARHIPYYARTNACCPGWTHNGDNNCSIPVCVPPCQNGGKCVNPNTCDCAAGYDGVICDGTASCSHLDPCYPGRCRGNSTANETDISTTTTSTVSMTTTLAYNQTNSSNCVCAEGFFGPSCLIFSENFKPKIERSNATFSRENHVTKTIISVYEADATDKTDVDVTWTNDPEFNVMKCNLQVIFDQESNFGLLPELPDYVRNATFGIVEGHFEILHTKINRDGATYVANKKTLTCTEPTDDNPIDTLTCNKEEINDYLLSSGDVYSLKFITQSGGFRTLVNTDYDNVTGVNYFIGPKVENSIEFRFDYDIPIHCYINQTYDSDLCTDDTAMTMAEDITRDPIHPRWSGWLDSLSGVYRYAFEIWRLEYNNGDQGLEEPKITSVLNPKPLYITEIYANNISFPSYEPALPGVYSCILEVNDKANNSEYVRRIVIFDKNTTVDVIDANPLYAVSASVESGFKWQTLFSDDNVTLINVTWANHFYNAEHQRLKILEKVVKYEPRLSDDNNPNRHNYKRILQSFDDNEGARTTAAIENINSIVKFEIMYEYVTRQRANPSGSNWKSIPLRQYDILKLPGHTLTDGSSVQVWVKAYDIMNHTNVDSTVVNFDKSPPDLFPPDISFNMEDGLYPLTTRFVVTSRDDHCGLKKLSLMFVVNSTGEIRKPVADIMVKKQTEEECPANTNPDCYCILDDCFTEKFTIDINNCQLTVPVSSIQFERYKLVLTAHNHAMLEKTLETEIGSVLQFSGIQQYSSPMNVTTVGQTDTTITVRWILIPTCYNRIRNVIVLHKADNTSKTIFVDKDATEHTIPDLDPSSSYALEMYSDYENQSHPVQSQSTSRVSAITMAEEEGIPQYIFYIIGGGFCFILTVVVAVLLILGRQGKLNKVKRRATRRLTQFRNTLYNIRQSQHVPQRSRTNRAVSRYFDNDVHFYGDMQFEGEQHWHILRRNISLEEELARGKFAIIYKAKLYNKHNLEEIVVAKNLQEDHTDIQLTEMKAKIHFYATQVGHHVNVLEFKGSVEDDARGPMMILEFCKIGTLKQYLQSIRDCFDAEISDRLARIAYSVCLGMDYIASKEIVHRRLAARNILLNHLYEPKITGFGPSPEDIGTNVNEIRENIPVKWVAPECMTSSEKATELSDVWSYGVVLWEIFSLGETPYPGLSSNAIHRYLTEENRMQKPEYCDQLFYNIMKRCWKYIPNKRPSFEMLKTELRPLFHASDDDEDIYLQTIKAN